jgi:hypothetical protein
MKRRAALLSALLTLTWCAPAWAFGVTSLGSNSGSAGAATTLVITTTADCPIGSEIVVVATAKTSVTISSVADSASAGSYAGLTQGANSTGGRFFHADNSGADLPSGGTITITYSSSSPAKAAAAACVSGVATSSPADSVTFASATGTGTTPASGATTTSTYASEIFFGFATAASGETYTNNASWTPLGAVVQSSAGGFIWGYQTLSATGSVNYNPTMNNSTTWVAQAQGFKGSGAPPTTTCGALATMGVGC